MAKKRQHRNAAGRWVVGVFTALYVLVAMLNCSLVQSYIGAVAGSYFSREWGGKVRIGAVDLSPFSHAVLYNIELISPTNDTIFTGKRIDCRFRRFPVDGEGLAMDRVEVRDARYHLDVKPVVGGKPEINLSYIINYYGGNREHKKPQGKFRVRVGDVVLKDVDYVMDLHDTKNPRLMQMSDSLARLTAPRPVSIQHMRYLNIRGHIRNVDVLNDHVKCRIIQLSTTEAGGMRVDSLAAEVEVCGTKIEARDLRLVTGSSRLMADVRMDYDGWQEMANYCHNVWHDITLKPGSRVNVDESAWWAPQLWGVDCPVGIEGHCYGTIENLHVDSLKADFGAGSRFAVRGSIAGLPKIDTTRMDVTVSGLHVELDDVADVGLPEGLYLEPLLSRFSDVDFIDMDAALKGEPNDCKVRVDMNSGIGNLHADAAVAYDSLKKDYACVGRLHSDALGVRSVLPNEWVSSTGVDLVLEGHGTSPADMCATMDGALSDTRLRGVALDRTTLSAQMAEGRLRLDAAIDDSLLRCTVKGLLSMDKGTCRLDVDLDEGQFTRLGLTEGMDSSIALTTHLTADLRGPAPKEKDKGLHMPWSAGVDDMKGTVKLKNTHCSIGSREVCLKEANLTVGDHDGRKEVSLECDWFDAGVKGWFSYKDFGYIVKDFVAEYLPGGKPVDNNIPEGTLWPGDAFGIRLMWKDREGTFANLVPGFSIASGSSLQGSYNYAESLKLVVRSEEVVVGGVEVHDVGMTTSLQGNAYAVRMQVGDVAVSGVNMVQSLKADMDLGGRVSTLALRWGNADDSLASAADLRFFLTGNENNYKLMVTRPDLFLLGQRWAVACPEGILFAEDGVDIPQLKIYGADQSLALKAHLGGEEEKFVKAVFTDFSLEPVGDVLLAQEHLRVDGIVDGTFDLMGIGETPYFVANLSVDDLRVNSQSAGRVTINSNWESKEKRIYVDLTTEKHFPDRMTRPLELHGSVLADGTNGMDLNVDMHRISLQTVGPMMAGFSSNVDGLLSGRLHLGGTVKSPDLEGRAWVDGGLLHVDVTGVTYYFDDTIQVVKDSLVLNDFAIRDGGGDRALLGGSMVYRNEELLMDLAFRTDRLLVLDSRPEGDNFYGRLLVGADGRLGGNMKKPEIYVRARTLEGSELHVPVSNRKQMSENEYVHFVSYDDGPRVPSGKAQNKGSSLNLQLDLSVTPGVNLYLPIDFSEITADAEARGSGDLRLTMSEGREPAIVGSYEFSSGKLSLSLLQLIEKSFAIEEGGTLVFPGNIQDARFDVKAVYNQRVNLATLTGSSLSGSAGEYAQVQNVIALAGTLENPSLKFDIRLPNADQTTVDQVNSLINLSNDRDMLNHTVSLLLLGRFANTGTTSGGEDLLADGWSSINVLASSMSSIVSNMVKVVDVDFKVQQSSLSGSSQIDVGISKQWNKVYFESSFGYGSTGTAEDYNPELNGVLVGDVVVGYKIKPYFSFYGFHRTNTSYYTRSEIPYKQGLGLKWSKEFNTLGELFRREKNQSPYTPVK